jgi:hypothetical protein
MKPGKLVIRAAWLFSMLAELSITNRKSTFSQPIGIGIVVPPVSMLPMSNLTSPVSSTVVAAALSAAEVPALVSAAVPGSVGTSPVVGLVARLPWVVTAVGLPEVARPSSPHAWRPRVSETTRSARVTAGEPNTKERAGAGVG